MEMEWAGGDPWRFFPFVLIVVHLFAICCVILLIDDIVWLINGISQRSNCIDRLLIECSID